MSPFLFSTCDIIPRPHQGGIYRFIIPQRKGSYTGIQKIFDSKVSESAIFLYNEFQAGFEENNYWISKKMFKLGPSKPTRFNMVVIGGPGSGKRTLIQSLLGPELSKHQCFSDDSNFPDNTGSLCLFLTNHLSIDTETGRIDLYVYYAPQLFACLDNSTPLASLCEDLESRHTLWRGLDAQLLTEEERLQLDSRIHCAFYFISASPRKMSKIDQYCIKSLAPLVPVIPIVPKSDVMTIEERSQILSLLSTSFTELNKELFPLENRPLSCIYDFNEVLDGEMSGKTSTGPVEVKVIPSAAPSPITIDSSSTVLRASSPSPLAAPERTQRAHVVTPDAGRASINAGGCRDQTDDLAKAAVQWPFLSSFDIVTDPNLSFCSESMVRVGRALERQHAGSILSLDSPDTSPPASPSGESRAKQDNEVPCLGGISLRTPAPSSASQPAPRDITLTPVNAAPSKSALPRDTSQADINSAVPTFGRDCKASPTVQLVRHVPNIFAVSCDPSGRRVYPWGVVKIDDDETNDFGRLKHLLFETGVHIHGIKDACQAKTILLYRWQTQRELQWRLQAAVSAVIAIVIAYTASYTMSLPLALQVIGLCLFSALFAAHIYISPPRRLEGVSAWKEATMGTISHYALTRVGKATPLSTFQRTPQALSSTTATSSTGNNRDGDTSTSKRPISLKAHVLSEKRIMLCYFALSMMLFLIFVGAVLMPASHLRRTSVDSAQASAFAAADKVRYTEKSEAITATDPMFAFLKGTAPASARSPDSVVSSFFGEIGNIIHMQISHIMGLSDAILKETGDAVSTEDNATSLPNDDSVQHSAADADTIHTSSSRAPDAHRDTSIRLGLLQFFNLDPVG